MIDFIKIVIYDTNLIFNVWNNPLLIYKGYKETRVKDEIKETTIRKYKNLLFKKHINRLEISGSIHKYYNNGIHNADDFTVQNSINTINRLAKEFSLNLKKCKVVGLEFAVNIVPIINVEDLIINLKYHKKREFIRHDIHTFCKQAGKQRGGYLVIKAYAKHLEYPQYAKANTFRFEVKTEQHKYLNRIGIKNLHDLTIPSNYEKLSEIILREWSNVLLFDRTQNNDQDKIYHNTDYWENLIFKGHRNTFNKQRKSYYKIKGKNGLHNTIREQIKNKLETLKECAFSTTLKHGIKKARSVHFPTNTELEFAHHSNFDTLQKQSEKPPLKKCVITGINLGLEKAGSYYIKTTTLRHLKSNDKLQFEMLVSMLMSNCKVKPKYEQSLISHLAKQVRNNFYNSNKTKQQGYNQRKYNNINQLEIFNFKEEHNKDKRNKPK